MNRSQNGSSTSINSTDGGSLHHADSMDKDDPSNSKLHFTSYDASSNDKLPQDPWVLRVRWRKDAMYPPGTIPPGSTHSSSIDLRRHSIASLSSAGGSVPSSEGQAHVRNIAHADASVTMILDIQLYEMEAGVYLVDFKCAGYESPEGVLLEEKDVTSPFPFLDLASKLIIQLAEAD